MADLGDFLKPQTRRLTIGRQALPPLVSNRFFFPTCPLLLSMLSQSRSFSPILLFSEFLNFQRRASFPTVEKGSASNKRVRWHSLNSSSLFSFASTFPFFFFLSTLAVDIMSAWATFHFWFHSVATTTTRARLKRENVCVSTFLELLSATFSPQRRRFGVSALCGRRRRRLLTDSFQSVVPIGKR